MMKINLDNLLQTEKDVTCMLGLRGPHGICISLWETSQKSMDELYFTELFQCVKNLPSALKSSKEPP
jgi:hypothetical protein